MAAGDAILPHFRAPIDVEDKGGARGYDPVTEADRAAEAVIRAAIAHRYPDHGIHGEEHGRLAGRVAVHVGDRSDRRHAQLHPRPSALGDADRAPRRRAADRRRHAPAVRRRVVRRARTALSTWRRGDERRTLRTRRCARIEDAVVATTDPRHFKTARQRAALRGGHRRRAARPLRRRLLLLHAAGDGARRHRHRDGLAGVRHPGADSADRERGRRRHQLGRRALRRRRRRARVRRSRAARRAAATDRA